MEIVVLNRLWHTLRRELAAELREARCKPPQTADLVALERQFAVQELLVARGQVLDSQVGDAVSKMIRGVWSFASLELGVQRQPGEPRLRRIAERPDRLPRVGEQEPGALIVVREHFGDTVGPASEEPGAQPRLE